ncbi:hypothetical protein [Chitinimonas sp. BJYL2]|uniref:hypothetical protein n=1 Tax=Chitinimonas sp. BJYL2 TaxID=2976696 RepID=UPI0022B384B5|nr:hypothetical protein [Chitinimonas sp. BJYL2]
MEREHCPKCGYTRQASDTGPSTECPRCGIVFAKYAQHLHDRRVGKLPARRRHDEEEDVAEGWRHTLQTYLFHRPGREQAAHWQLEALGILILMLWGAWFVASDWREGEAGMSFLHNANLAFHEFGHLLFRPFGEWMMFLGGSLFQCLVPLIFLVAFVWQRQQPYAGAVCLWWFGQNLIDVAPYIGDARSLSLPLIGEWNDDMVEARMFRHDWHNILDALDMLGWDHRLAALAHWGGATIMVLAIAWACWWIQACRQVQKAQ